MLLLILCISLFTLAPTIKSSSIPFGIVYNLSLEISQGNASTVKGVCSSCLCALAHDPLLFAFNCFEGNRTCEMFAKADQHKPFTVLDSVASAFYFVILPTYLDNSSSTTALAEEQSALPASESRFVHFSYAPSPKFGLSSDLNRVPSYCHLL